MADGNADRIALLLEHLALHEKLVPGLRGVVEPSLFEVGHVVGAREGDPEPRDGLPAGLGLAALRREVVPAAALLADLRDHVVHADEEIFVEEGVGARGPVHVVAGLRLGLGGDLGRHLQVRHRVHAHRAVVGLAECLGLLAKLVVGGGHEMVPGEEGQLPLLGMRGRLAQREPGRHARSGAGSPAEELTSGRDRSIGGFHPRPPFGHWRFKTVERETAWRCLSPLESDRIVALLYRSPEALSSGGSVHRREPRLFAAALFLWIPRIEYFAKWSANRRGRPGPKSALTRSRGGR